MSLPTKIIWSLLITWRKYSLERQMRLCMIWPPDYLSSLISSPPPDILPILGLGIPRISCIWSHCFFFVQCPLTLLHLEKCNLLWMVPQKSPPLWKLFNTHHTHRINHSLWCWHKLYVFASSVAYVICLAHSLTRSFVLSSVYLSMYLSLFISIIYLSINHLFIHPSIYPSTSTFLFLIF